MSNNQNNPQEVPQVKSVEENASDYCKLKQKQGLGSFTKDDIYFMKFAHMAGQQISSDRIAELEAREKLLTETLLNVRDRHRKAVTTYQIITKALRNEK